MRRVLLLSSMLAGLAWAEPARAVPTDGELSEAPAIIVQAQPLEEWFTNALHLNRQGLLLVKRLETKFGGGAPVDPVAVGNQAAKFIDDFVSTNAGKDWRKAIDTKRPIFLVGDPRANWLESTGVLMVPFTEEAELLKIFAVWEIKPENKNGVYEIAIPEKEFKVYLRLHKQYAYVTVLNSAALDLKRLPDPTRLLDAADKSLLSVRVYPDRVPAALKQLASIGLNKLPQLADESGDSDKERQRHRKLFTWLAQELTTLMNESQLVRCRLVLDRQKNEYHVEGEVTPKPGTKLAERIQALKIPLSPLVAVVNKESAASYALHSPVHPEIAEWITGLIEDAVEEELPKADQPAVKELIKLGRATLLAQPLNAAVSLRGPSAEKRYGLAAGVAVSDGRAVEKALRDLAKLLPEKEAKLLKLDAAKIGDIALHRFDLVRLWGDAAERDKVVNIFGEDPLWLAVRGDAIFAAYGDRSEKVLRELLASKPAAMRREHLEVAPKKLQPLIDAIVDNGGALGFVESVFGADVDRLALFDSTFEGGVTVKLSMGQTMLYPAMLFGLITHKAEQ